MFCYTINDRSCIPFDILQYNAKMHSSTVVALYCSYKLKWLVLYKLYNGVRMFVFLPYVCLCIVYYPKLWLTVGFQVNVKTVKYTSCLTASNSDKKRVSYFNLLK